MRGSALPTALTAARVDETAELLSRALHDDPAYAFIFPHAATRPSGLAQFFRGYLRLHVPHRCTVVLPDEAGPIEASVTLRPPGGLRVSVTRQMRGLAPLALRRGMGKIRRLRVLKERYEALEARGAEGGPYWHVHMMAVRPDRQGRGTGGRLLGHVLATLGEDERPVVLTTHKEVNVSFYLRHGFALAFQESVQLPDTPPYTVWCMRRGGQEAD